MMKKSMNKARLKLVYSEERLQIPPSNTLDGEDTWDQLDLFSQPETVFFTAPEACSQITLIELLKAGHVTQVIDLRQIPHFSFSGFSRPRFFEALDKLNIRYLTPTEKERKGKFRSVGSNLIFENLKQGPLMVLSDIEPEQDSDIRTVIDDLADANIKYVPVFASENMSKTL